MARTMEQVTYEGLTKWHRHTQVNVEAAMARVIEKTGSVWGYHLTDAALELAAARITQRIAQDIITLVDDGLDPLTATAEAYMGVQRGVLSYSGFNSTNLAANATEQAEHLARLSFLEGFGSFGYATTEDGRHVTPELLMETYRVFREGLRAKEQADKALETALHEAKFGRGKNDKGKTVTRQGIRAALKKSGAPTFRAPTKPTRECSSRATSTRTRSSRSVVTCPPTGCSPMKN